MEAIKNHTNKKNSMHEKAGLEIQFSSVSGHPEFSLHFKGGEEKKTKSHKTEFKPCASLTFGTTATLFFPKSFWMNKTLTCLLAQRFPVMWELLSCLRTPGGR